MLIIVAPLQRGFGTHSSAVGEDQDVGRIGSIPVEVATCGYNQGGRCTEDDQEVLGNQAEQRSECCAEKEDVIGGGTTQPHFLNRVSDDDSQLPAKRVS
jgi:hypothetical protein